MYTMKHRYTTPSNATITITSGYPHFKALKYSNFGLVDELMPLDEADGTAQKWRVGILVFRVCVVHSSILRIIMWDSI